MAKQDSNDSEAQVRLGAARSRHLPSTPSRYLRDNYDACIFGPGSAYPKGKPTLKQWLRDNR